MYDGTPNFKTEISCLISGDIRSLYRPMPLPPARAGAAPSSFGSFLTPWRSLSSVKDVEGLAKSLVYRVIGSTPPNFIPQKCKLVSQTWNFDAGQFTCGSATQNLNRASRNWNYFHLNRLQPMLIMEHTLFVQIQFRSPYLYQFQDFPNL